MAQDPDLNVRVSIKAVEEETNLKLDPMDTVRLWGSCDEDVVHLMISGVTHGISEQQAVNIILKSI